MTNEQLDQLMDALRPFAENAPFYDGYGNVSALFGRTPRRPTGADYHRAADALELLEELQSQNSTKPKKGK